MQETYLDKKEYTKLWLSFIDGDIEAFSKIYKLSYKKLYSFGISFKLTDHQIRDAIQDIFLKLYTAPNIVKDSGTLYSFIFMMMRNSCINTLKWYQKFSNIDYIDAFEITYSVNIIEKDDQDHIRTTIASLLSQLTPRQKEIISLRFLHQMEYEEIAYIMGLSEQSARNLTSRAIENIRNKNKNSVFLLIIVFMIYRFIVDK